MKFYHFSSNGETLNPRPTGGPKRPPPPNTHTHTLFPLISPKLKQITTRKLQYLIGQRFYTLCQKITCRQGCDLWRNRVKLLSFSEQLIQPYLEGIRRTGTGLLEVRDFLRVKIDDLWLPVQKSSTSVFQRSGRYWHPARATTGCEQNGGNLNQFSVAPGLVDTGFERQLAHCAM